jgi:hypothetical protein
LEQGRPTERVERHLLAAGFVSTGAEELRARCGLDLDAVIEALRALTDGGRAVQVGPKDGAGLLHADRVASLESEVLATIKQIAESGQVAFKDELLELVRPESSTALLQAVLDLFGSRGIADASPVC